MSEYSTWCRNTFAILKDGGRWGLPSTGLIFEKRGNQLVLVESIQGIGDQRDKDQVFNDTVRYFGEIGVEVVKA